MPERGPLLAWETSTEDGVVCLGSGAAVTGAARFRTVKGHAGWLMPLVDSVLKAQGTDPRELRALAAGIGPGGFTGVKVGVATAKAMALALGPQVRINAICPGWIRTDMVEEIDPAIQQRILEETALKRWGTPDDVASSAVLLASDEASFITGELLIVAGGRGMH